MAVTIRDIYAPVLGFGWENLPTRYTDRLNGSMLLGLTRDEDDKSDEQLEILSQ